MITPRALHMSSVKCCFTVSVSRPTLCSFYSSFSCSVMTRSKVSMLNILLTGGLQLCENLYLYSPKHSDFTMQGMLRIPLKSINCLRLQFLPTLENYLIKHLSSVEAQNKSGSPSPSSLTTLTLPHQHAQHAANLPSTLKHTTLRLNESFTTSTRKH